MDRPDHVGVDRLVASLDRAAKPRDVVEVGPVTPQLARLVRRPYALVPVGVRRVDVGVPPVEDRRPERLDPRSSTALRRGGRR